MNQIQKNIKEQIKTEVKNEIKNILQNELKAKKPSGHVAAGKKWDTTEKGRLWKSQTLKAKNTLRNIIKERTGLNAFANQRMTFKYAAAIRDGDERTATKIIEEVIDNAIKKSGKQRPNIQFSRKNRKNFRNTESRNTESRNTESRNTESRNTNSVKVHEIPKSQNLPTQISEPLESDFPDLAEPFSYEDDEL